MEFSRTIELQMGNRTVELQMSPVLVENIKAAFGLTVDQEITESHVKYYLSSGLRNALESSDVNVNPS